MRQPLWIVLTGAIISMLGCQQPWTDLSHSAAVLANGEPGNGYPIRLARRHLNRNPVILVADKYLADCPRRAMLVKFGVSSGWDSQWEEHAGQDAAVLCIGVNDQSVKVVTNASPFLVRVPWEKGGSDEWPPFGFNYSFRAVYQFAVPNGRNGDDKDEWNRVAVESLVERIFRPGPARAEPGLSFDSGNYTCLQMLDGDAFYCSVRENTNSSGGMGFWASYSTADPRAEAVTALFHWANRLARGKLQPFEREAVHETWLTDLPKAPAADLWPVAVNDRWGYIDRQGKLVVPLQFDWADSFSEGLAAVPSGDLAGYIDAKGLWAIPAKFRNAGEFHEGLASVRVGERWTYIDRQGAFLGEARYGYADDFHEHRGRVKFGGTFSDLHGRWGFVGPDGQLVIPCRYLDATNFSEGLAAVEATPGCWGFIDTDGKMVIAPGFDAAGPFSEGLARVCVKGKWGYIDRQARLAITPRFIGASEFRDGLAAVGVPDEKDPEYHRWVGYIDHEGQFAIKPRFIPAADFSEGLALVYDPDAGIAVIDRTGRVLFPVGDSLDLLSVYSGGLVRRGYSNSVYLDRTGKVIWSPAHAPATQPAP
jgi:hypothetical protein